MLFIFLFVPVQVNMFSVTCKVKAISLHTEDCTSFLCRTADNSALYQWQYSPLFSGYFEGRVLNN